VCLDETSKEETMRLVIGADHAGFALKEKLRKQLQAAGHEIVDVGAYEYNRDDDYPDFAAAVGRAVVAGEGERGILVCGSGVGACIAANKIDGVRACLCHDIYSATQGVEHDDMNVLCLGGLIVGDALAEKLVQGFIGAQFIAEGRFQRRLDKVLALEDEAKSR
jgi:ribose 5-phosphate isomerase B